MSDNQPNDAPKSQTFENEFSESGKTLYLDAVTADVRFSFGVKEDKAAHVPAHKNLLAAKSNVFKSMFYGGLKETGNVHVPDVSNAAFIKFLQYFYLSEVKLSTEHIEGVFYLGQKYNVEKCINDCIQFLIKTLNNQNVCNRLRLAILYEEAEMKKACEKHILLNTVAVFKSADFLTCDQQVLAQILKMNLLSCSEVQVFEAIMSWVKAKSKAEVVSKELVEAHLGNLFYQIRFASMKIEEFCVLANEYDSVLSRHFRTITNIIVLPNSRTQKSVKFNTSPRHVKWNKNAIVKCEWEAYRYFEKMKIAGMVKFSTNVPLLLGSFTCGEMDEYEEGISNFMINVKIYELHDENGENESGSLVLEYNTVLETGRIAFPNSILIKPGFFYVIELGPFSNHFDCEFHHTDGKIQLESDITIKFYDCNMDYNDSDYDDDDDEEKRIKTGIIKGLNFNRI